MKITVLGSHLCPDTMEAVKTLEEKGVAFDFHDFSADLAYLKEYLALREGCELYAPVKAAGRIGIPCFIRADGSPTLDLETALAAGK